ncbi:lysophospholipid acyltransferase family protein [Rhodovulum visakhapatnamense]|uniref:Lyso-ornithine lipid acyltransferase n=2 Tax=Rhodovulum visakhapatnamense TaxID=364297 RepID=A0A4R8FU93_9RHOB|nr:lysophospholipid acyltransferase family protein [Rhodovulum visakhapatnamense]TDX30049.1 lyso-ornithine lipid acyltransferase [Rhodovulum visakhapatnamense]
MSTWRGAAPPEAPPIDAAGWLRVALRGGALIAVLCVGMMLKLTLRLVERPLFGLRRPVTPWITQGVSRAALAILGMRYRRRGRPMRERGALVANHASWLDIFALNAGGRVYFVSKAEVADWPGIGWLARAAGTVFIAREKREAKAQADLFETRLKAGHRLVFFPEGTSTDGRRVLPFKSTLFAAFFGADLRDILWVQPVTVVYTAPEGEDPAFYGWWGDMGFGPHALKLLATARPGGVELVYHPPLRVAEAENRKALALACETAVRSAAAG